MYERLTASRQYLSAERRNDLNTKPPYSWHWIDRESQQRAVVELWQKAPVGSIQRKHFDKGATSGEHAPNWVTLWLLYSVFRSRDIRNNRSHARKNKRPTESTKARMYDQVRNVYRPRQ